MSTITLKVRENAKDIPIEEWERLINWFCDLRSKHGSGINIESILAEQSRSIRLELDNKNLIIADLNKQLDSLRKTITKELSNNYEEELKREKERIKTSMQTYIDDLKQQIKSMRSDNELIISDRIKSIQATIQYETEIKNKIIDDLKNQIANMRQTITAELTSNNEAEKKALMAELKNKIASNAKVISAKDEQIASLESIVNDYRTYQTDSKQISDQITSITETIKPLIKFYNGSNEEKGTSGENLIANILRTHDRYADGTITDTSGQGSKGDLLFKWRQLRCMFEVKNKKTITVADMEKFTRDVTALSTTINCAAFISLNTDIFPGRTRESMQVDFINGTTVIYTYLSNNDAIHYVLACLEKIVAANSTNEEQTKLLAKYFIDCFNHISETGKFYEKQIILKNKEIKQITKQLNTNNKLYNEMHPSYLKCAGIVDIEISSNVEEEEDKNEDDETLIKNIAPKLNIKDSNEYVKKIKEIYIDLTLNKKPNSRHDLLNLLSIDDDTLDALGGYDDITSAAKLDYTASILTPDVVSKIAGTKPTRKDLIQKKILTDSAIRRLFSVIKTKKQIEYITNYCNTQSTDVEPMTHSTTETDVEPVVKKSKKKSKQIIDEPF